MNLSRDLVKTAVNILVGLGTYKIMVDAIDHVTPEEQSTTEKLVHYTGSAAISGVVCDATSDYTNKQIDRIFDAVTGTKSTTLTD